MRNKMQAHDRFRNLVYGMALALMIGWILYIGQNVFVPVIASVILTYIVWPAAWKCCRWSASCCRARSAS